VSTTEDIIHNVHTSHSGRRCVNSGIKHQSPVSGM